MSHAKILLVEDEKDIRQILSAKLKREGYKVVCAPSAESGLMQARKQRPDLIILDISLPRMDGLELCRILRAETQVPIFFLTAKTSEVDQVVGLKLGADDYVTKPFSPDVLLAKIKGVLHRVNDRLEAKSSVSVGNVVIDFDRHDVLVNGRHRYLGPKEFQILELLYNVNGKVISREKLLEQVWGYAPEMDIDTRTVDQHIARIRQKLRPEGSRIATVRKFGYKLQLK